MNEIVAELSVKALADIMSDDCVSSVEQDYTIVITPDEPEPAEPIDLMDTRQKPRRRKNRKKPGNEEEEEEKLAAAAAMATSGLRSCRSEEQLNSSHDYESRMPSSA
eukprot:TRINITY_DN22755_c0_g1_i1.p1 TRINITY_DN22755_c0_g1~~TRINITY_DN22755_c0_g1_i1.p1  ORF type:complete len:107 (+),score=24.12 TRINITY_DN22755_c0_g1_i1:291-611(+)